jgi:ATP-dependent Clp endopeptidase proteolytic subunit ClpP
MYPHDNTFKRYDNTFKRYHAAGICTEFLIPFSLQEKKRMLKRFFNVIPGENVHIYIYGNIDDYEGKAEDIASELLSIQNTYGSKIIVHINSLGGEVYSGIAIVNALKNSNANIVMYIDGIAASMASVIALCGKPLFMSRYARLMLHNVKVGVYGDKEDLRVTIDEIDNLENTLCEIIAGRIGKTPEEIKTAYFDGRDHWFTANEALGLGLIDGIYDVEAAPENSSNEQIYKIFNNRLKNPNEMNIEEIKKRTSFVNAANDADVLRIIDGLEVEAARVPELTERISEFEKREKERDEAEVNTLLDAAIADERIKPPQRAQFYALLKADRANGEAVLKSLTPKKRVMNVLNPKTDEPAASAWDQRMEDIRKKNLKQ